MFEFCNRDKKTYKLINIIYYLITVEICDYLQRGIKKTKITPVIQ